MWNRIEVAFQVGVDYPTVAFAQMTVHLAQRILAAQTRAEAKAARLEFVLKDRLNHQLQCGLDHAILNSGYTERAQLRLAARLRYVDRRTACGR